MGFRNKRQSTEQTNQSARSTANQSTATESSAEQSTPNPSQMGRTWPSIERAEEHFGIPIPNESTLQRLEDHERTYGRETHEWIAEGMPADIMGSPKSMEAFRQRQAERPPEVPTNIERQNRNSVFRSEKAAGDTSPAGQTGVPEPVREVISSTGRSLDGSIQRAMEDRMGDSFGDVRIHTGSTAANACESINARAFTVGNHIAFNSGEYDPESPEGQHVLAHELAHVRQQTKGAVSMLPQENMELEVDPDPALEREAEEAAQQAMAEGPVVVNRMGCEMHIQRMANWGQHPQVTEDSPTESTDTDDQTVSLRSILESAATGGMMATAINVIVQSGAIHIGAQDLETAAAFGGAAAVVGTAVGGGRMLAKQLSISDLRQAFAAAGELDLLERLLSRADESDKTGEGDSTGDVDMDASYEQ